MEGDVITLSDLYTFDYGAGIDADGRFLRPGPAHRASARRSRSTSASSASSLPAEMFGETDLFLAGRR